MHGTTHIYKNHNYICILCRVFKGTLTVPGSANMLSLQGMSACNLLDFESTKTWSINYVNIHAARPHVVRFGKVKSGLPCLHILN